MTPRSPIVKSIPLNTNMPIGPQGQIRPSDSHACAIMVCKIATGEAKEQYEEKPKPKIAKKKSKRVA